MCDIKTLANENTLLRTHWCPLCFLGCANWETFVAGTKCFWTKSETFFVFRTQNLCPQQMLRARANVEKFVSATMCPQQCVLVCQGLKSLYISLPSTAKQQREMTKFCVFWNLSHDRKYFGFPYGIDRWHYIFSLSRVLDRFALWTSLATYGIQE